MKYISRLLCAAGIIASVIGCAIEDNSTDIYRVVEIDGPYIQQYFYGPLQCVVHEIYDTDRESKRMPYLSVSIDTSEPSDVKYYNRSSSSVEARNTYAELCNKHNDLNFHGFDVLFEHPCKFCYAKDITSIDLTSNSDFDKQHPAGTSLMDIMTYQAYSFGRFIGSGYEGDMSVLSGAWDRIEVTRNPASELEPEDMMILGSSDLFLLYFNSQPERKGKYGFTLTITFDDKTAVTFDITADMRITQE